MSAKVALLRGVNVSGKAQLPMADFRALLADLGLRRVQTYIQSGNAVFDSELPAATLETMIRDAIAARFGFAPETFVLEAADIATALTDHPFAGADPARVHVFFLKQAPRMDEDVLRALALPGDGWRLGPKRFTLHAPAGIGRSRLAGRLERLLPAPMTARNLRTLAALQALLAERA